MLNLQSEFKENMKSLFKEEYEDFIQALNRPPQRSIRFNERKLLELDENHFVVKELKKLKKVPWQKNAYYLEDDSYFIDTNPYFMAGLYYYQEASAMSVANYIPIEKGMKVLDLCTAPGGKTLQLAETLGEDGFLLSNDISVSRQRASLRNIEKFGLKNVFVSAESPEKIAKNYSEYFDAILVDAPCSGEGMFAKDKKTLQEWSASSNEMYSKKQSDILDSIAPALKKDGYLMYSTCTFSEKENENIIADFLNKHIDFELINIDETLFTEGYFGLGYTKRILPHKQNGLGHFLALMKKTSSTNGNPAKASNSKKKGQNKIDKKSNYSKEYLDIFFDFCSNIGLDIDAVLNVDFKDIDTQKRFKNYFEKLYFITDIDIPEKSFRTLRNGLFLGEIKHNKFIPSQHFAMAISNKHIKNKIVLSIGDINLEKYLRGESLSIPIDKGYFLIYLDNLSISWGLSDGRIIKNKFKRDWITHR